MQWGVEDVRQHVATMMDKGCVVIDLQINPAEIEKAHLADLRAEGYIQPSVTERGRDPMKWRPRTPLAFYPYGMQGEATRYVHANVDHFVHALAQAEGMKYSLVAHDRWSYETGNFPPESPHALAPSDHAASTGVTAITGWYQCSGGHTFNYWPGTHAFPGNDITDRSEVDGFRYLVKRYPPTRASSIDVKPGRLILFYNDLLHFTTCPVPPMDGWHRRRLFFAAGLCNNKEAGFNNAAALRAHMGRAGGTKAQSPTQSPTQSPPMLPSGLPAVVPPADLDLFVARDKVAEDSTLIPVPAMFPYTVAQAAVYFPRPVNARRGPTE